MQRLIVTAKPQPISIDPARTAVVVVDMQNDFGSKGGMFDRAEVDISGIQKVVRPISSVVTAARAMSIPIIHLKTAYRPDLSDLGAPDAPNRIRHLQIFGVGEIAMSPDGRRGRILVRNSWGTDIIDDLKPEANDIVVCKSRFSGFYETELDAVLRTASIKHLVVTGCTTSVCVESTIRDAFFRDYHCLLLTDCTSEPVAQDAPRTNYEASIALVERLFGWTSTSELFLKAITAESGIVYHA